MSIPDAVSRRALFGRIAGILAAAASIPSRADAQAKVSKKLAKYQDHPNGQQRCDICVNFRPPDRCRIVEGRISKSGWCQFFAAKENAH